MKKLIVTLILATMGGVSLLQLKADDGVYNLDQGRNGLFPIVGETVQFDGDYRVYTTSSKLNYHVENAINRILKNVDGSLYNGTGRTNYNLANVSFSTNEDLYLGVWADLDKMPTNELRVDMNLKISDYGIYFLDEDDDVTGAHRLYSTLNSGVEVTAGRKFGVYYTADSEYYKTVDKYYTGDRENTYGQTYTTTENWLASYDYVTDKDGTHIIGLSEEDPHSRFADDVEIRVKDAWFINDGDKGVITDTAFWTMFQGPYVEGEPMYLEWSHFEFGFVTGEPPAGQPLPGTLATLLISGLCAGALRKRSKKH